MDRPHGEGLANRRGRPPRAWLVGLFLGALTLAVFGRTANHGFITLDDEPYVYGNAHVRAGLSWDGVRWAFTTGQDSGFIPLTCISRMLDVSLFGMDAGAQHLVNVLFHAGNTLLLFLALRAMTGRRWESAIAAALFGVHPLHVESVAWVTERKDVLSGFFFMLCLLAYDRYARRPGWRRYLPLVLFCTLGLLSKPMIVTLPFVLLLLDYWPLGRVTWAPPGDPSRTTRKTPVPWLLLEKVPLLLLAAASAAATVLALAHGSAVSPLEALAVRHRIANALVSYAAYLAKTVWPSSLSVFYPHPLNTIPPWKTAGAALLLAALSAAALRWGRRAPYLPAGWLWFLGMLVPVIGLAQAGQQGMADRFTYLPLVGPFVAAAWGASAIVRNLRPAGRTAAAAAGAFLIAGLAATAWIQTGYWRDSYALYEHSLAATNGAWRIRELLGTAHRTEGSALMEKGDAAGAAAHFREALRQMPNDGDLHARMGAALGAAGQPDEALRHFRTALSILPGSAPAHTGMGYILLSRGEAADAAVHFKAALKSQPGDPLASRLLEEALRRAGR